MSGSAEPKMPQFRRVYGELPPGWKPGDRIPDFHDQWRGFRLPGLTMSSLRKKWSLIPLFIAVGGGMIGAGCYLLRLAVQNPDVTWKTPEPWNKLGPTYKYKFYAPVIEYDKLKHHPDRPDISEWKPEEKSH